MMPMLFFAQVPICPTPIVKALYVMPFQSTALFQRIAESIYIYFPYLFGTFVSADEGLLPEATKGS